MSNTNLDAARRIGPFSVFLIGLGCMSLNYARGTAPPVKQAERVLLTAIDAGVTLFDTAAACASGANERLVGRVLEPHRQRIVLATKGVLAVVDTCSGQRPAIGGRLQSICRDVEDIRAAPLRGHTGVIMSCQTGAVPRFGAKRCDRPQWHPE